MKIKQLITLLLIFISIGVNAQGLRQRFAMVSQLSSVTWTTIDSDTYRAGFLLQPDQTASGFNGSQIVDSFKIFVATRELFDVDIVHFLSFDSINITVTRVSGTGSPTGQVMIYNPGGRLRLPSQPYSQTGSTFQMINAVDAYNADIVDSGSGGATTRSTNLTKADNTTTVSLSGITPTVTTVLQVAVNGIIIGENEWDQSGQTLTFINNGTGNNGVPPTGSLISIVYN